MSSATDMFVIKRDGRREAVQFDKVLERIRKAANGLSVNYTRLAQLVLAEIHDDVHTSELDELAARLAVSFMTTHPDWGTLAAQIAISNCQRSTPTRFSEAVAALMKITDRNGRPVPALARSTAEFVATHADTLDAMVRPENDFLLDYFGFKTLEKAYLMRDTNRRVVETPQYMWLRVAVGIWGPADAETTPTTPALIIDTDTRLARIRETYELLSVKAFTHATPTLFNSGTPRPQMSSCFLAEVPDSIDGIYDALKQCAQISKYAGGIGLHIHNVRAEGSLIGGTLGESNGIVPMLRVFNDTARYVDQCFAADTLIVTDIHGNTKRIADLRPNDTVLTSGMEEYDDGITGKSPINRDSPPTPSISHVRARIAHQYSGTVLHLTAAVNNVHTTVTVTPDHPMLALVTGSSELDYVPVKYLKPGDLILCPIKATETETETKTETKTETTTVSEVIDITEENVTNQLLYDLEIDGTHDYTVAGVGIAHNGGGRRKGSFAIYLEPWHADIQAFLRLKANTGPEEERARDLFYGMWIPDLFMRRVEAGGDWSLFCPHEAPGLADVWGAEFDALYTRYEAEGRARRTIPAQKLWGEILVSQIETGTPYLCYKDAANAKSNQQNLGTIKSSNLCSEIIEYSSVDETAVCNLASIALPHFVSDGHFNFDRLRAVTAVIVRNLNRVIDVNFYPTPETRRSNFRHRPIGIGVQGLADVFALLGLAWETDAAAALNREIFENIYFAAVSESATQAEHYGTYETYPGCPASNGRLQPDLWTNRAPSLTEAYLDWPSLRRHVARYGLRNSLLLAPMPTASTSQVLGYNEAVEPFTSNIYVRRTLAGEFTVLNQYLVRDLLAAGLWTAELKDRIVAANGSIQAIPEIPDHLKARYKTVWEIKQKTLIDMAAERGAYICQSQSLNLFVQDPTIAKLSSMHFYAWRRGLKTGIYYLRTKSSVQAIKFTVDPTVAAASSRKTATTAATESPECLLCSS